MWYNRSIKKLEGIMRYLLIVMLVMFAVYGCGCSGGGVILPAFGFGGDDHDCWPALFGTDNGGPDNGYFICYDQSGATWDAAVLITNDLLNAQWTPQRNSIGWDTYGKYNASFIETASNDLEIWESPDDGWQDDGGAWALLDDEATWNWTAVDLETRQNYIWAVVTEGTPVWSLYYIDLLAGVPAFTNVGNTPNTIDNTHYSITLDDSVQGYINMVLINGGNVTYAFPQTYQPLAIIYTDTSYAGEYPQILGHRNSSLFYTDGNVLYFIPNLLHYSVASYEAIYTANSLTADYHAAWLKLDDTIHVVLVDVDFATPNSTYLVYMRRTPNGWTEQEILLTVDSVAFVGDADYLSWPQITVDPFGNIFVYYIFADDWTVTMAGDLQGFYLDAELYDAPQAGNWVQHTNIDGSATDVVWVVAPDSIPISGEM